MILASPHRTASLISLLLTLAMSRAIAGQCVTKASSCTEFVAVGPGSDRILVYRNRSLTTPNDTVTRALIVVHGAGGPARWEFRNVLASAFLTGNLETTVIVAPHFATNDGSACTDSLAVNELNWNCDIALGDWRVGGRARNDSAMSSFDAMDAIVRKVASRAVFPNLKSIVVAGHSAGGQFVALYKPSTEFMSDLASRRSTSLRTRRHTRISTIVVRLQWRRRRPIPAEQSALSSDRSTPAVARITRVGPLVSLIERGMSRVFQTPN